MRPLAPTSNPCPPPPQPYHYSLRHGHNSPSSGSPDSSRWPTDDAILFWDLRGARLLSQGSQTCCCLFRIQRPVSGVHMSRAQLDFSRLLRAARKGQESPKSRDVCAPGLPVCGVEALHVAPALSSHRSKPNPTIVAISLRASSSRPCFFPSSASCSFLFSTRSSPAPDLHKIFTRLTLLLSY